MHFSHAIVAALSVVATQTSALPVRNVAGPSSGLTARSADVASLDRALAARGMAPDAVEASRGIFARYADVADEHERSMYIARDLSKRGILDMLVAALRDLLVELLGKGGTARKRDSQKTSTALEQLTGLDFSTKTAARQSWSQMLDALSKALEQESQALAQNGNSTTASKKASQGAGAKSNSTSTALPSSSSSASATSATASASADTALPSVGAEQVADRKANVRQGNKASKRDATIVELAERQEEGLTGLLQVLRNLVDAILNTLLPMSSRSASDSSNSTSQAFGQDCPPAGTPNDGMYRPGCPGYGRRAVSDALLKVRDAAGSSQQLQEMLPLLEELIQRLPELSGQTGSTSAGDAATTSDGTAQAGNATATNAKDHSTPLSAAKLSLDTRSLLEADGFALGKRQADTSLVDSISQLLSSLLEGLLGDNAGNVTDTAGSATNAANGATSTKASSSSKADDTSSDSSSSLLMSLLSGLSKRDGIDVNALNNLLGNLLSGDGSTQQSTSTVSKRSGIDLNLLNNLLGNLLSGDNSSQQSNSDASKRSGININALNNLLGNLLSGDHSAQESNSAASKRSGININALNNLLGNLLSGDDSSQESNSAVSKRSGININALNNLLGNLLSGDGASQASNAAAARRAFIDLTARADFKPVWDELKKVGNSHFHMDRRDAAAGLTPVWSSFRDMVDGAYSNGLDRRSPSPKVDTSAFSHAAAQYMKQTFFHHDRRSMDHYQPLIKAAGSFAKDQMQEWTEALNEHSAKHGKIQN